MAFTNYTIVPDDGIVVIDGMVAQGVNMTGIPPTVQAIQWYGIPETGTIEYKFDVATGEMPAPEQFTDPADFSAQTDEAEAIIYAYSNPVTYYSIVAPFGKPISVTTVGWPQPPNTTTLVPPAVPEGQTLQWDGSAWVVSSFDITLSLPAAKSSLIQTVTAEGAAAVNAEVSLYSTVQQIEAPSVAALETKTYPGTTIGEYQTYVDAEVASATATINAATSTEDLYSYNPTEVPLTPSTSGTIFTGRGDGLGPEDMNVSYYTVWNSTSVVESDTELYIPGTSTVISYGSGPSPNQFDSFGNCFIEGDYQVQIRQVSTGFVIAQYECPLSLEGEDVSF